MRNLFFLLIITVLCSCGAYSPYYNGRLIHGKSAKIEKKSSISDAQENEAFKTELLTIQTVESNEEVSSISENLQEEQVAEVQNTEDLSILVKTPRVELDDSTDQQELDEPEDVILQKAKKAEKSAKKALVFGALGFTPFSGLVFMIIGWIFLAKALRSRYITEKGQRYAVKATIILSIVSALLLAIIVSSILVIFFL
jgi:hypothetical protein